jgi:hypothetical protein
MSNFFELITETYLVRSGSNSDGEVRGFDEGVVKALSLLP